MILTVSDLAERNKWWSDVTAINSDIHIVEATNSGIDWDPKIFAVSDLETDAIYTLRGPRQVGKTTHVKFTIKNLLEKIDDPRRILYLACDPLLNRSELWETLTNYLRWIKNITRKRIYIFLDEVTMIKDWQIAVKDLYDGGLLENTVIIATGSHSLDIKKGGEQLPGRRGKYKPPADRELLPMTFPEFVKSYEPALYQKIEKALRKERTLKRMVNKVQIYLNALADLFDIYMLTGGFPKPVSEYKKMGKISIYPYNDMKYYIRGDIAKAGKKPETAEQILSTIIEKMGTMVGYNTIAEEINIDSKTVKDYVETLQSMYLLTIIYQPNPKTWQPVEKKKKKIYLNDPFILHVAKHINNEDLDPFYLSTETVKEKKPEILEMIATMHTKKQNRKTFFWRTKKGKEIDTLLVTKEKVIAIEIKQNIDKEKTGIVKKRLESIPTNKNKIAIITGKGKQIEIEENTIKIPIEILLILSKHLQLSDI